jgi:hypothetical protein
LRDREHPEHAELKEWAGDFDPEHFDLGQTARAVARVVVSRTRVR